MKTFAIFAVAFCVFALYNIATAVPVPDEEVPVGLNDVNFDGFLNDEATALEAGEEEPETLNRQKRATCDLLSFGGKVNHSACAAHCLVLGKRGGYCSSKAVCVCRK